MAIRKTPAGLTVAALAACPVTSGLLGNGDPVVAYNAIKHQLLKVDADTALMAAMSSLALSSGQTTHLGRLEDFGSEHGYDQRQVRRYSDRGIGQLARLIATNWATISVPQLDVTVVQTGLDALGVFPSWRHHYYIEMRPLKVTLRGGDGEPHDLDLATDQTDDGLWLRYACPDGVQLRVEPEASVIFVWVGELWAKYAVEVVGRLEQVRVAVESLGSQLMIKGRLWTL